MKYKSLRGYPITLTAPNGQNVVVYPGSEIELPEEVGDKFSGLLFRVPSFEQPTPVKVVEVVKEIKEKVVEDIKLDNVQENKVDDVEVVEEPVKRKAGRPKKS